MSDGVMHLENLAKQLLEWSEIRDFKMIQLVFIQSQCVLLNVSFSHFSMHSFGFQADVHQLQ